MRDMMYRRLRGIRHYDRVTLQRRYDVWLATVASENPIGNLFISLNIIFYSHTPCFEILCIYSDLYANNKIFEYTIDQLNFSHALFRLAQCLRDSLPLSVGSQGKTFYSRES